MFEQSSENSASTKSVGFEGDKNKYRWGERVSCLLEVNVEFRDQRPRKIHGCEEVTAVQSLCLCATSLMGGRIFDLMIVV